MTSLTGDFVRMTTTPEEEVRADLIHLLLTRKGTRYFLPDFGTRIYDYIFDMNDSVSYDNLEREIRDSIKNYLPNLDVNSITIVDYETVEATQTSPSLQTQQDSRLYRVASESTTPYTAQIRIDYTVNNGTFGSSDFVIINI